MSKVDARIKLLVSRLFCIFFPRLVSLTASLIAIHPSRVPLSGNSSLSSSAHTRSPSLRRSMCFGQLRSRPSSACSTFRLPLRSVSRQASTEPLHLKLASLHHVLPRQHGLHFFRPCLYRHLCHPPLSRTRYRPTRCIEDLVRRHLPPSCLPRNQLTFLLS